MWMVFDTLVLIFMCLPLELLHYFLIAIILGWAEPYPQSIVVLRYRWKLLWGKEPTKVELDCVNGYLYYKLTYKDGTTLLWRGD